MFIKLCSIDPLIIEVIQIPITQLILNLTAILK